VAHGVSGVAGSEADRPVGEGARDGADAALKAYLAETVDARCPSCRYRLAGVTLARCPECGMPLDVELVRDGPARAQQPMWDTDPHIDGWAIGLMVVAPATLLLAIAALTAIIAWLS
jgi:hypothetical protein